MGMVPPRPMAPYEAPVEHVDFGSLPISKHTGLPYDPELISYPYGKPKPKRKFRLFKKREKSQPKQEHVSLFEVTEDEPYAACENSEDRLRLYLAMWKRE